jgi:hypothetical protein
MQRSNTQTERNYALALPVDPPTNRLHQRNQFLWFGVAPQLRAVLNVWIDLAKYMPLDATYDRHFVDRADLDQRLRVTQWPVHADQDAPHANRAIALGWDPAACW